jgi:hypothetical protein
MQKSVEVAVLHIAGQLARSSLPTASRSRLPHQPALIPKLPLRHLLHELLEIFVGKAPTDFAEAPSYLCANFLLTEGVEL